MTHGTLRIQDMCIADIDVSDVHVAFLADRNLFWTTTCRGCQIHMSSFRSEKDGFSDQSEKECFSDRHVKLCFSDEHVSIV